MKSENITEKSLETKARWERLKNMTDDEVSTAIADDPDSKVPNEPEFLAQGVMVKGNKENLMVLPITVDLATASFLSEHHIDCQTLISGILKAYV